MIAFGLAISICTVSLGEPCKVANGINTLPLLEIDVVTGFKSSKIPRKWLHQPLA